MKRGMQELVVLLVCDNPRTGGVNTFRCTCRGARGCLGFWNVQARIRRYIINSLYLYYITKLELSTISRLGCCRWVLENVARRYGFLFS